MAKLTKTQWTTLRKSWEAGETAVSLGKKYGVDPATISRHQKENGWVRGGHVDPVVAAITEVDVVNAIKDAWNAPPLVDTAAFGEVLEDSAATRIAELEAERADMAARLAKYEPTKIEWPYDEKAAERLLRDELNARVEAELEETNLARMKRGAPPISIKDMEVAQPGWFEKQKDRIITETVESLTKHATNVGPATRTLAMRKKDGTVVKVPLDEGIGNYGLSPAEYIGKLKAKGHVELNPQPCARESCWAQFRTEFTIRGGVAGVDQPLGYCGPIHFQLDPAAATGGGNARATTTGTFSI